MATSEPQRPSHHAVVEAPSPSASGAPSAGDSNDALPAHAEMESEEPQARPPSELRQLEEACLSGRSPPDARGDLAGACEELATAAYELGRQSYEVGTPRKVEEAKTMWRAAESLIRWPSSPNRAARIGLAALERETGDPLGAICHAFDAMSPVLRCDPSFASIGDANQCETDGFECKTTEPSRLPIQLKEDPLDRRAAAIVLHLHCDKAEKVKVDEKLVKRLSAEMSWSCH